MVCRNSPSPITSKGHCQRGIDGQLDVLTKVMAAIGPSFDALAEKRAPVT